MKVSEGGGLELNLPIFCLYETAYKVLSRWGLHVGS